MTKTNQQGAVQTSVLVAGLMTVLFVVSLIFALTMFMAKQDLSTKMDRKVAAQVAVETKAIEAKKDAELAEKEKSPTKTYVGPSTIGSVSFAYPKTYSAYVAESAASTGTQLSGYFHPNVVPKDDRSVSYGLRAEVSTSSYDSAVRSFDTPQKSGKVTVKPFRAALVPSTLGVRIDGEIINGKQGVMILLPVRDKTLKIWTESKDFVNDFNTFVVPSISFVP